MKLALPCLLAAVAAQSSAAVVIRLEQVGADVVGTATGSFDSFQGLTFLGSTLAAPNTSIRSAAAWIGLGNTTGTFTAAAYSGLSGPANLGTPNTTFYGANSGSAANNFFINDGSLRINVNYVLGTPLDNTSTWTNKTFADLGVVPGTYTYSWAGDSVTLHIGTPVPEPSTYGLLLGGLALAGAAIRRRRK